MSCNLKICQLLGAQTTVNLFLEYTPDFPNSGKIACKYLPKKESILANSLHKTMPDIYNFLDHTAFTLWFDSNSS